MSRINYDNITRVPIRNTKDDLLKLYEFQMKTYNDPTLALHRWKHAFYKKLRDDLRGGKE